MKSFIYSQSFLHTYHLGIQVHRAVFPKLMSFESIHVVGCGKVTFITFLQGSNMCTLEMSPIVADIIESGFANSAFINTIRTSVGDLNFFCSAYICMTVTVYVQSFLVTNFTPKKFLICFDICKWEL